MKQQQTTSETSDHHKKPVQIAERIWWVGHVLPDDPFQCHVYLIENGDQSVLVDPGSMLTFRHTLAKIEQILPFSQIRYFICHHQDPDITSCLPLIDQITNRRDAVILSHWRAIALLKHLGLSMPFECVEKMGWRIDLGSRELEFIFTPYLHFPGAFCTFEPATGSLFSSDLFGGFTEKWQLFAEDGTYFEAIRPFHEHYMPSRDILFSCLCNLEKYPLELIAPQHGSIIPKKLIPFIISKLKTIDCGLFLMSHTSSDVRQLTKLNAILQAFLHSMATYKDFKEIVKTCLSQVQQVLPISHIDFLARQNDDTLICLTCNTSNAISTTEIPSQILNIFSNNGHNWVYCPEQQMSRPMPATDPQTSSRQDEANNPLHLSNNLIIPLVESGGHRVIGIALLKFADTFTIDEETKNLLVQLAVPLSVAVERELIYRSLEFERQKYYEQSIRDPLTQLYTRIYMHESVRRLLNIHDRNSSAAVGIISLDIDHFKAVNDNFGHQAGDEVLKEFAAILIQETRSEDIQVRLGGEEFAVFIVNDTPLFVLEIAERIRQRFNLLNLDGVMQGYRFSVSCGAIIRKQQESLQDALHRADTTLYRAKKNGRNQVCSDFLS
ncbi:MAG: diguanylate cyclase [Desulfoprunum sp.]|nr:diguanylate cyclase [Desulfoprunum sp.]